MATAAFVVSVVALALSGWAALSAHRQAKAAERATEAAEDQLALLRADQDAAARRAPWRIDHHRSYLYFLTNMGGSTCYDVTITGDRFHRFDSLGTATFRADEIATFFAMSSAVSVASRVTVQWADRPGAERREWTRALPPRNESST